MTENELKEIKELFNKPKYSAEDKTFIRSLSEKYGYTGKLSSKGCQSCWHTALFYIINKISNEINLTKRKLKPNVNIRTGTGIIINELTVNDDPELLNWVKKHAPHLLNNDENN